MNNGKVILTGAGPGDPELITLKALDALSIADTVLYDKLANPELLNYCSPDTELIFSGKEAGKHYMKQDEIISLMIRKAKEGKTVVRLKGGDPLIFGRGSEEALELQKENIEFEIIPGITAATGATAYCGLPLTHRNVVTQCVFVTAHESPGKSESQVDWKALAKMKNTTIVIYMGAKLLPEVVNALIEYGMNPDMPAAVIEKGTKPDQRSLSAVLKELPDTVKKNEFKPPMLTIISPAAPMINDLNWFEKKPLFGKRIVVTRAKDQAASLYKMLYKKGAQPVSFPCIRTEAVEFEKNISDLIKKINFDWIIFSSENGVRWFFKRLRNEGKDPRILGDIKIAAIGSGTYKKIEEFGLIADFIPSAYTSSVLVKELSEREYLNGKNILRIKGYFKLDPLTDGLIESGANVKTLEVYDLQGDTPSDTEIKNLKENGAAAVLFTSISTVDNFFRILGSDEAIRILNNSVAVSIGPVTAEALKERKIKNFIIADTYNLSGLVEAVENHFNIQ